MSFLSKRIEDQQKKEDAERAAKDAAFRGFGEDDEEEKPASRSKKPAGAVSKSKPESRLRDNPPAEDNATPEGAVVLDTGYVVPPKLRTTPKVAKLRKQLRSKLLAFPDEADLWDRSMPDKEEMLTGRLKTVLQKMNVELSEHEFTELREGLLNDLLGFGAIEPLVQDRRYSEIMVNGGDCIFAEFKGKLTETEYVFDDEDHVLWTAQRVVRPMQRTLDRANPMVDARLPDGSRVHIVSNPSALNGTTVTIRKFPEKRLTVEDLIKFGSFTHEVAEFLEASVVSRLNIVVSGGTGSGKTTLLNVLSSYIPEDERIITVEDAAELQLAQRHVVRLETAPPIPGGNGQDGKLSIRDLVKGSLRMRPDRLVIGEVRDGAALDMLQAMNTGHDGSLTTVHSNSPRDAVARLETLCLMAGMDLPVRAIREQVASAIDLIVHQERMRDGTRKVVKITEIQGMEGDIITMSDIFEFEQTGIEAGKVIGRIRPTGLRPKFIDRIEEAGIHLPPSVFGIGMSRY